MIIPATDHPSVLSELIYKLLSKKMLNEEREMWKTAARKIHSLAVPFRLSLRTDVVSGRHATTIT